MAIRKLASIQKIKKVEPIEGADNIEKATILGWQLVVKKGEFLPGQICIYCEVDSIMPEREEFEFLRPRGFRIKTIKLRKQISQGIAFPMSVLPQYKKRPREGDDVTELLGVRKYVPNIPAHLSGEVKGAFPGFISKTDEIRIQSIPEVLIRMNGCAVYATEKLDGTSGTFYLNEDEFGVCSRNLELFESEKNTFWEIAKKYEIEKKLRQEAKNYAIQGEIVGVGIQKNKYKLEDRQLFVFDVFDIDSYEYLGLEELIEFCKQFDFQMVPLLASDLHIEGSAEGWVEFSKGRSALHDTKREGIVVRTKGKTKDPELGRLSFKAINPEFLLKHGE